MDETQKLTLKNYVKQTTESSAAKRAMAVLLLESDGEVSLAVYPTEQLLIIWDNCGWHRGSEVVKWTSILKHFTSHRTLPT